MKIDLKARLKNKYFWGCLIFTVIPMYINNYMPNFLADYEFFLSSIATLSASLGFIIDPSTDGFGDKKED